MEIRNGVYFVYRGKPYQSTSRVLEDGMVRMFTYDKNETMNGFVDAKYKSGMTTYVKTVHRSEIESAFSCTTYGSYKGYHVQVVEEENEKYLIHTGNSLIGEKLGLEEVERSMYDKWVNKNEVEGIWEDRRECEGFPMPPDRRVPDKKTYG